MIDAHAMGQIMSNQEPGAHTGNASAGYQVESVSKIFFGANGATTALENVSIRVPAGSFACLLGPSGCGKSTLLRILGGLETATSGHVNGSVDTSAFVFQEHGVFPWFTVQQNVEFGLKMKGVGKQERRDVALHWINAVGLSEFRNAYPHNLSGGMRQRTAIARAFALGADGLLMDEPLGALDAQTRQLMQEELLRLWGEERKTVVLVTHQIEEALLLGDEVFVMSARPGRVKRTITVPFSRTERFGIEGTKEFAQLRQSIWEDLREEVQLAQ